MKIKFRFTDEAGNQDEDSFDMSYEFFTNFRDQGTFELWLEDAIKHFRGTPRANVREITLDGKSIYRA